MKTIKQAVLALVLIFTITQCTTVESGNMGVFLKYGSETDTTRVLEEGLHFVAPWHDVVEYNVRQRTITKKFIYNDNANMTVPVEISVDYRYSPRKVNRLHKEIDDIEIKIIKAIQSACKEVIPQYTAVQLNISKRTEAEELIEEIIAEQLPKFYVELINAEMTDVDIPESIAEMAKKTAVQMEKNLLAEKMEAEKISLAKAVMAEARGDSAARVIRAMGEAAEIQVKQEALRNAPDYLKLKELDVDMLYGKTGKSRYGENNVFGSNAATVIKGLDRLNR